MVKFLRYWIVATFSLLSVFCGNEWKLQLNKSISSVSSSDGCIIASSDDKVYIQRQNPSGDKESSFISEPFFEKMGVEIKKVHIPSYSSSLYRKEAYAINANNELFVCDLNVHPCQWTKVLEDKKIIDISGKGGVLAILQLVKGEEKSGDAVGRRSTKCNVLIYNHETQSDDKLSAAEQAKHKGKLTANKIAVTDRGWIYVYGEIKGFVSTVAMSDDFGATFRNSQTPVAVEDGQICACDFGIVFVAGSEGGVLKSGDFGKKFESITKFQGMPLEGYTAMVCSKHILAVGTNDEGLYMSVNKEDLGAKFQYHASVETHTKLPSNKITSLDLIHLQSSAQVCLYIGTPQGLVSRCDLSNLTGEEADTDKETRGVIDRYVYGRTEKIRF